MTFLWLFSMSAFSQDGVGIGTDNVNPSAVLEVHAANQDKGLLIPRAKRSIVKADQVADGLIIYDIDSDAFFYCDKDGDSITWRKLMPTPADGNLNMNDHKITGLIDGTSSQDAVNKGQLDTKLSKNGGNMYGNINMNNRKVVNLTSGTNSKDAVNKGQLDTKLNLSGGTMSGNINMSNKKVVNLANGSGSKDAINKSQLDALENRIGRLHQGTCWIGDIGGDTRKTCNFGGNIGTSNYVVVGSLRVNSSAANEAWKNNDITYVILNESSTGFQIDLQEQHSDFQKLMFRYVIFKM